MSPPFPLPDLPAELCRLLRQVPFGRVTTYGRLAQGLGDAQAARWVASWLLNDLSVADLPRQRVVLADGKLGRYHTGDVDEKSRLLLAEGVKIVTGRVDLSCCLFDSFQTTFPLRDLQDRQTRLLERLTLSPLKQRPAFVAGMDVSYSATDAGCAAYTLFDTVTRQRVWSTTLEQQVDFPYITGYLAYRELPILLALWDKVRQARQMPDVVMIDGNGILHPRRAGIATHFGILADVPTLGVSKTLICGTVPQEGMTPGTARPITFQQDVVGMALQPPRGGQLLYISPGHRTNVATALELVREWLLDHHLPEPTHWADALSHERVKLLRRNGTL